MRKICAFLAVLLIAVSSLVWESGTVNAARSRTCPAANTTIKIKRFSIGSGITDLALGPKGNIWFTLYDVDRIGRLTPRGKITNFSDGITPNPENAVTGAVGPRGITKGPDGNMWFTEYGANRIGRITPDGTITEFSAGITPPSGSAAADFSDAAPHSIVTGADGNLWFTEQIADRVARITPDGVITEFGAGITPSPSQALLQPHQYQLAQPGAITKGADGNVWFVEELASRVARVTPEGAITEFPIPIEPPTYVSFGKLQYRIARVNAITAGKDGNVWFTEGTGGPAIPGSSLAIGAGAIGRITPRGEITEFIEGVTPGPPDPTSGVPTEPSAAGLRGITRGPDGNLWALNANGLVRITPQGEISEFPAKVNPGFGYDRMIAGSHGTLWYINNRDQEIARVAISCSK